MNDNRRFLTFCNTQPAQRNVLVWFSCGFSPGMRSVHLPDFCIFVFENAGMCREISSRSCKTGFKDSKFLANGMQNGDEFFMRQALDEARKAFNKGAPIGAVVDRSDRIVGRGHNLTETLADPTAHAEMQALTAASGAIGGKYLNECRLYVTVEPCVMCAGACFWCQVGQVIYGARSGSRGVAAYAFAVPSENAGSHRHSRTRVPDKIRRRFFESYGLIFSTAEPSHRLQYISQPYAEL